MEAKKYRRIRVVVSMFVGMVVAMGVTRESYLLALAGVLTGMVFMGLARSKIKMVVDERERQVREKTAEMAFAIFTPTIGLGSFLLLVPYKKLSSVFAGGEFVYLESLGMILAYLTLFLIALYAIAYHMFNRKLGGGGNEK
jgi:uncharacterized membrane protein